MQWALTRSDAANMMPSFAKTMYTHRGGPLRTPSSSGLALRARAVPLGEPLGPSIDGKELGPALGKGSYNAELYGPLKALAEEGVAAGTDVVLGKNRLSGLWGGSSALGSYLDFNEIRTLFFAGGALLLAV
jgi:nicotinamidase-related amidase